MSTSYVIQQKNANLMWDWFQTRGGVAVWNAVDFSGDSTFTPADCTRKPGWKYPEKPTRIVTDPAEFTVDDGVEFRRIKVALRRGSSNPFLLKITDASQRKVDKALARAGEGAWYEKGDLFDPEIVIYTPNPNKLNLPSWVAKYVQP